MKYSTQRTLAAAAHIFLLVLGIFVLAVVLMAGVSWAKGVSGIFPQSGAITLVCVGIGAGAVLIGKGLFYFLDCFLD